MSPSDRIKLVLREIFKAILRSGSETCCRRLRSWKSAMYKFYFAPMQNSIKHWCNNEHSRVLRYIGEVLYDYRYLLSAYWERFSMQLFP